MIHTRSEDAYKTSRQYITRHCIKANDDMVDLDCIIHAALSPRRPTLQTANMKACFQRCSACLKGALFDKQMVS